METYRQLYPFILTTRPLSLEIRYISLDISARYLDLSYALEAMYFTDPWQAERSLRLKIHPAIYKRNIVLRSCIMF